MSLLFQSALPPGSQYRRFPAPGSTLDLDFLNNRGVVAGVVGGVFDRIPFARSTTGTYFDSAGVLQTAAINVPRLDCDPLTGAPKGFLLEPARSNLLLNSATLSTQNVTVTAVPHTLSFWGTGTVTLSGTSTAGPLVGTATNDRVSLTFTPTAGPLTLTVSGTVTNAQLEAGLGATSYIPTTSTALSRGAEVAQLAGTNFSDWYNQAGGTFIAEFTLQELIATAQHLIHVGGVGDNRVAIRYDGGGAFLNFRVINTTTQCSLDCGVLSPNTIQKCAVSFAENNFKFVFQNARDDLAGSIPALSYMDIGQYGGYGQLNGHLRRLTYIPRENSFPALFGATR